MDRRTVGRIAALLSIGLLVAGGAGPSWRSLGLEFATIDLGLYRVTVCADCDKACTVMHERCEDDAKARYGACNRAECHVENGKTVCASNACKEEGHCATQLHRCKAKCETTPACETTLPFDAGRTLQLGSRDRHLMALAGLGGIATLVAGLVAVLLLAITALRPRRVLATVALVAAAFALVAGVGFVFASGMKSPVGGTSFGWSAIVWVIGSVCAIVAAALLRVRVASGVVPDV